ncbi:MAG: ATP-dependent DNA helicase RecG [Acidobacteriota bacterium]|nr:ATP-dependent DNA helicase RecG [Pyrinomonadaceae bacterium]MDW8304029.1 ATP-dependent DNA helicase RecG [Acidobacteriota bacterium]
MSKGDEKIRLDTPIFKLCEYGVAGLSKRKASSLAYSVAAFVERTDPKQATVEDLLSYLPMRWEDRSNLVKVRDLKPGMEASLDLYVRVAGGYRVGRNRAPNQLPLYIFEISASDKENFFKPVVIWWFVSGKNAEKIVEYYKNRFQRGTRLVAYGKWEWDPRRATFSLRINKPDELELLPGEAKDDLELFVEESSCSEEESLDDSNQFPMIHTARRVPVYRKLGQFRTKALREIVFDVLQKLDFESIDEKLPQELLKKYSLIPLGQAYREIHFPPEDSDLAEYEKARSKAHRRLIFEEFFWMSFCLQLRRRERIKEKKGTRICLNESIRKEIFSILPFDLTNAQKRVVEEIFSDMVSDKPMNRLIQGDVGSGKTIVALLAMLLAVKNGYQAALMVPTEILAEQHAKNIKKLVEEKLPYKIALLTGSLKVAEKRRLHQEIAEGKHDLIIGTHALIQEGVKFAKLGLAVIDEQHRFGVLQRAELQARGYNIDTLVMTATPIPRSLAMTVYGDLDVSIIDELPPGRTPIKTVVLGEDKRAGVYKGIRREIGLGRQVYIIYPLVEESEKMDLKAATEMYERLRSEIFPEYRVGLLHGKMKPAEKEAVMQEFVSGRLHILVATTVVEVGVDVPNASLMIIEHAERFGLSQLHQLRGRVGRGAAQSYCVLMTSDKQTETAKKRLGIMEETSDGFKIAEKDLEIRGPGDILGTKQSGLPEFRIGNLVRDLEILDIAKREAACYLNRQSLESEVLRMIETVKSDPRFRLAGVG